MSDLSKLIGKSKTQQVVADVDTMSEPTTPEVLTSEGLEAPREFSHESQPDKLTPKEVAEFRECIELLENNLDHKEIVGNAITNLLKKLNEREQYRELLLPEDCDTMVKALRESYGVAITIKSSKTKKKTAKAEELGKIEADLLGGMEISI